MYSCILTYLPIASLPSVPWAKWLSAWSLMGTASQIRHACLKIPAMYRCSHKCEWYMEGQVLNVNIGATTRPRRGLRFGRAGTPPLRIPRIALGTRPRGWMVAARGSSCGCSSEVGDALPQTPMRIMSPMAGTSQGGGLAVRRNQWITGVRTAPLKAAKLTQSRCRNLGKEKDAGGRRRTVDAGGDLAAARPGTLEGEQEEGASIGRKRIGLNYWVWRCL